MPTLSCRYLVIRHTHLRMSECLAMHRGRFVTGDFVFIYLNKGGIANARIINFKAYERQIIIATSNIYRFLVSKEVDELQNFLYS